MERCRARPRSPEWPYVGSGVFGSAAAMDKDVAKRLMRDGGLPIPRFLSFAQGDAPTFEAVVSELGRPVFVKPARLGSSVGISKAATKDEFAQAVAEAFRHDRKILVEEYCARPRDRVRRARGRGRVADRVGARRNRAQQPPRLLYLRSQIPRRARRPVKVPADLPRDLSDKVRKLSVAAFRALGCEGLARIDFFLREDGKLLVNEVNTLPGFTNISMYPKVMEAIGIRYPELVDRLIRHALARANRTRDE